MSIDKLTVDTIRLLSAESVEKANSGHPGLPLGAAPMAYALWAKQMKHNGKNPNWLNRDRFVLSAGHGSMLLYSLLHLFGYDVSIEDLKSFRQLGSKTPGHPEYGHTEGVDTTTGPLGQGLATAVGFAMAEAHMSAYFNRGSFKPIDHYTYVLASDGDMMEGITNEASSLAGNLGLGKLIVLYDSNSITIEGNTDLAFTENVRLRYEALGWETILIEDGTDIDLIERAIQKAKENLSQPSFIEVVTNIGYGTNKQDSAAAHGSPLGSDEIKVLRDNLSWNLDAFEVPVPVKEQMEKHIQNGIELEEAWKLELQKYTKEYPDLAKELDTWIQGRLPLDYLNSNEFYSFDKPMATRQASGIVINRLAKKLPNLIGGSADLAPSNNTNMNDRESFSRDSYIGSNIHFGIREHAMAAALNGMGLHGGLKPFAATFFIFSDYLKPALRLSSLMEIPVTYVLTHDSIGVGEDGPTHQPIEQLAMFRAQPNLIEFRPADARETAAGWHVALTSVKTPVALILTRQELPLLDGSGKEALKGAYIIEKEEKNIDLLLMATGSEVHIAIEAAKELKQKGIDTRVVSMPSWELFEQQDNAYKEEIIPKEVTKRISVEAGSTLGWHKYIGLDGVAIGMDTFGASGPGKELFKHFGFTKERIVEEALKLI